MLDKIANIGAEQGFLMTFAIVVLFILCYIIHIAMEDWKEQKALERAERQKDREIAIATNERYAQIVENQSRQIERSTISIQGYQTELSKHTERSELSFKEVVGKLDDLDGKIKKIGDHSDGLATKEMVADVSEDIKYIKDSLKKD